MKVWLVYVWDYDDLDLDSVWTSKELANRRAIEKKGTGRRTVLITEFEIDTRP